MSDEPYSEWAKRVYTECAEANGLELSFMIYCLTNHYEIVKEFKEFDRQMRSMGFYIKPEESE